MDPLRLSAPGSVALQALKPIPPPAPPAAQPSAGLPDNRDLVQGLAQDLFQRTFLTEVAFPVAGPTSLATDLRPVTGSLLTALNAPPPVAEPTPAENNPPAIVGPAVPSTAPSTAPTATPPALPGDLQNAQGIQESGLSLDFALQTALRFGAGVGAQAAPTSPAPNLGAELVRDAATVPRQRSLQAQAGGPGPEAFAHPQAPVHRALRSYQVPPSVPGPGHLDLFA